MLVFHLLTLSCLGIATVTDIRKREVPDYLAYFFIVTAFLLRLWYTEIYGVSFIIGALIAFVVTFTLGFLLYRNGLWGGGDVFMLAGVAAAFGLDDFFFIDFLLNFFVIGSLYGVLATLIYGRKEIRLTPKLIAGLALLPIPFLFLPWNFSLVIGIALFALLNWDLFKRIEKSMVLEVPTSQLSEGDWLAEEIKIGNRKIKAGSYGLSKEDIRLLRKHRKKVKIRVGIPFVPSFFITYVFTVIFGNFFLG